MRVKNGSGDVDYFAAKSRPPKTETSLFFTLTNLFNELLNQRLAPFQEALWFYLLNHLMASLSNKCTRGNAALLLGSVYRYSYCFVA